MGMDGVKVGVEPEVLLSGYKILLLLLWLRVVELVAQDIPERMETTAHWT